MSAFNALVMIGFYSILAICLTSIVADVRRGWPVIRIALGLDKRP